MQKNDYYTVLLPLNTIGLEYNYSSEYIQHYILQTQYAVHTYIHIKEERKKKRISMMNCKKLRIFLLFSRKKFVKKTHYQSYSKKKHDTHGHPYTRSYTHMMMLLRTIMLKKIVRFLRKTKNLCESWQTKKKTKTDLHKNVLLFLFQAYRSKANSKSLFLS